MRVAPFAPWMGQERIAVTVWGERISPVLDVSSRALLLTVQDGQTGDRTELKLPDAGGAKLAALSSQGIQTVLCGAVSQAVAEQAAALAQLAFPGSRAALVFRNLGS